MQNIEISENGSQLILTVDLAEKGKPSSTKKMQLLASSGGWKRIEQGAISEQISFNFTLGYKLNGRVI